uniref:Uncharacterized protein n=1 Tax=Timema bartmani TaxID=61472 RepID=A0A7R9I3K1_9NEOP|nr:unnamed protein product [Timema bartmani]
MKKSGQQHSTLKFIKQDNNSIGRIEYVILWGYDSHSELTSTVAPIFCSFWLIFMLACLIPVLTTRGLDILDQEPNTSLQIAKNVLSILHDHKFLVKGLFLAGGLWLVLSLAHLCFGVSQGLWLILFLAHLCFGVSQVSSRDSVCFCPWLISASVSLRSVLGTLAASVPGYISASVSLRDSGCFCSWLISASVYLRLVLGTLAASVPGSSLLRDIGCYCTLLISVSASLRLVLGTLAATVPGSSLLRCLSESLVTALLVESMITALLVGSLVTALLVGSLITALLVGCRESDYIPAYRKSGYIPAYRKSCYIPAYRKSCYIPAYRKYDYIPAYRKYDYIPAYRKSGYIPAYRKSDYIPAYRESCYIPAYRKSGYIPAYRKSDYIPAYRKSGYIPAYRKSGYTPAYRKYDYIPAYRKSGYIPAYRKYDYIPAYRKSDYISACRESDYILTLFNQLGLGDVPDKWGNILHEEGYIEQLTTTVMSAVASGECLQRMSCQLGRVSKSYHHTITTRQGRVGALFPPISVMSHVRTQFSRETFSRHQYADDWEIEKVYPRWREGSVGNNFVKTNLSTSDRDLNLDFHVIGSLDYCESSALDHTCKGRPEFFSRRYTQRCSIGRAIGLIAIDGVFEGFEPLSFDFGKPRDAAQKSAPLLEEYIADATPRATTTTPLADFLGNSFSTVPVPGYDHHAFTNCSASMAEAKAWQFQRTSNLLTSTLKKDQTVLGSSLATPRATTITPLTDFLGNSFSTVPKLPSPLFSYSIVYSAQFASQGKIHHLDIFEEGNSAPAPVEDTADNDDPSGGSQALARLCWNPINLRLPNVLLTVAMSSWTRILPSYGNLRNTMKSNSLSRRTKVNIYNTIIRTIVLYGYETWTARKIDRDKLDNFERRCDHVARMAEDAMPREVMEGIPRKKV